MYPEELLLDHFIGEQPNIPVLRLCRRMSYKNKDIPAEYDYIGWVSLTEQIVGRIFVCGNHAYKIERIAVRVDNHGGIPAITRGVSGAYVNDTIATLNPTMSDLFSAVRRQTLFTISWYTDDQIDELRHKLKRVQEQLSVCADSIEDICGPTVANKFRTQAIELRLEDIV